LNYEAIDTATFASWGIDFVKLDAGCQDDCSIHDSCLLSSLTRIRDGLNATGRTIVYYIDDGNPTSGPKVFNPFRRGWQNNSFTQTHVATKWSEYVASWGPDMANMWKLWFDREDTWESLMGNVHQQVGLQWFQSCNAFHNPDFLTNGQGGMTNGQYRAEMFLYAILGAPLILSFDLTKTNDFTMSLVTNPEILAVNQDKDCVMGTLVNYYGSEEVWIRPLSDGSFAAVLLNKDPFNSKVMWLKLGYQNGDDDPESEDFYAAGPFRSATVRDLYSRITLGQFSQVFNALIPPMDAMIVRVFPHNNE